MPVDMIVGRSPAIGAIVVTLDKIDAGRSLQAAGAGKILAADPQQDVAGLVPAAGQANTSTIPSAVMGSK